jgi:hypothetical protein
LCRDSLAEAFPAIGEAASYKPLVRYRFFLSQIPRLEDHAASGGESGVLLRSIVPARRIHRDLAVKGSDWRFNIESIDHWVLQQEKSGD